MESTVVSFSHLEVPPQQPLVGWQSALGHTKGMQA